MCAMNFCFTIFTTGVLFTCSCSAGSSPEQSVFLQQGDLAGGEPGDMAGTDRGRRRACSEQARCCPGGNYATAPRSCCGKTRDNGISVSSALGRSEQRCHGEQNSGVSRRRMCASESEHGRKLTRDKVNTNVNVDMKCSGNYVTSIML